MTHYDANITMQAILSNLKGFLVFSNSYMWYDEVESEYFFKKEKKVTPIYLIYLISVT